MMKKLSVIAILSLLVFAILSMTAMAAKYPASKYIWQNRINVAKLTKAKLAGGESASGIATTPLSDRTQSLGVDDIVSNSPGVYIGTTTYDLQSNTRMTRQIGWRGTQMMHFVWMWEADSLEGSDPNSVRATRYEAWDPDDVTFVHGTATNGVGIVIHSIQSERSGYTGLDVDYNSKAIIHNHHGTNADDMSSGIWFDNGSASGFFTPGKVKIPDSLMEYGVSSEDIAAGDAVFLWPYSEYQVWGADTVTHVFSQQAEGGDPEASYVHYFRHVGHPYVDSLGVWDYPPIIVDTIPTISQIVTVSPVSPKVALVWQAPPGAYPGDPESMERDWIDPGLGVNQRTNDVYIRINDSIGDPGSWGSNQNISGYDSTVGGWLGHGDMSALYDTDDYLHVVWNAREITPPGADGGLGEYTYFYGARILHWDQYWDEVRPVVDANWDILQYDEDGDTVCTGGAWNEVSIVKPMLSECEGKFYVVYVQFLDLWNGVYNDCAEARYSGGAGYSGTANGELYLSVSNNGGRNWDAARNLTNTPTPFCYSDEAEGTPVCESDHYPSMPRLGQELAGADFSVTPIVDPSDGGYGGDYYLDIQYINDKFPGSCMQDGGVWSTNPVKWFRIPCVEPVVAPDMVYSPVNIGEPTWTHSATQFDSLLKIENVGNAPLTVDSTVTRQLSGPVGWLAVSRPGQLTIDHISPTSDTMTVHMNNGGVITATPSVVTGYVVIYSNTANETDAADSIPISLIVADTLMFPEVADIRTDCKRISYSNAGELGDGGGPGGNGGYNMNFFDDCDTTNNEQGEDDHAGVYLYSASPFLAYASGGDTVLNSAMFDATWLSEDGFRPLTSPEGDSSNADYQYGTSTEFLSKDSTVGMEVEIYAPIHPDTCSFIVAVQKFYLKEGAPSLNNAYLGDFFDWDIPADSGSENGSGFDASRQMMYCYGAEYGVDTGIYAPNNDCVLADQRFGGSSYYGGWKLPMGETDSFPNPQAMWTHMNADWVYPAGGFVPEEMYRKLSSTYGYQPWQSTNPTLEDSLYQDLHMVLNFGQFTIAQGDTLLFFKIIMTEYDGALAGLEATHTKAQEWIKKIVALYRPVGQCCYGPDIDNQSCADETRDECEARGDDYLVWLADKTCADECAVFVCDCEPGNANGDAVTNIFDVTYLISYLYKGGPEPTPYLVCSGDPNGIGPTCVCNIFDVTYLISYLYKGGPDPVTCEQWLANCGGPPIY